MLSSVQRSIVARLQAALVIYINPFVVMSHSNASNSAFLLTLHSAQCCSYFSHDQCAMASAISMWIHSMFQYFVWRFSLFLHRGRRRSEQLVDGNSKQTEANQWISKGRQQFYAKSNTSHSWRMKHELGKNAIICSTNDTKEHSIPLEIAKIAGQTVWPSYGIWWAGGICAKNRRCNEWLGAREACYTIQIESTVVLFVLNWDEREFCIHHH